MHHGAHAISGAAARNKRCRAARRYLRPTSRLFLVVSHFWLASIFLPRDAVTRPLTGMQTSSSISRRRRVDWPLIMGTGTSQPGPGCPLPRWWSGPSADSWGRCCRPSTTSWRSRTRTPFSGGRSRSRAKDRPRAPAIFLLDGSRQMMLGTWGTDLQGAIVDEHRIMFSWARPTVKRSAARARKAPTSPCSTTARSWSTGAPNRASLVGDGPPGRRSCPSTRRSACCSTTPACRARPSTR